MDDTPETIRQQMEETRLQLNEKLETLELQVTETMQSTGTALNATVEAVQETVESVSDAVQDAVHSVSNAFDLGLQIERHPLIVLGGAVVLGYLASDFFAETAKKSESLREPLPALSSFSNSEIGSTEAPASRNVATVATAYESGRATSTWNQLRDVALGVLISVVQDITIRSVPRIVDYLTGDNGGADLRGPIKIDEQTVFSDGAKSFDDGHQFRIASSGSARIRKPF